MCFALKTDAVYLFIYFLGGGGAGGPAQSAASAAYNGSDAKPALQMQSAQLRKKYMTVGSLRNISVYMDMPVSPFQILGCCATHFGTGLAHKVLQCGIRQILYG